MFWKKDKIGFGDIYIALDSFWNRRDYTPHKNLQVSADALSVYGTALLARADDGTIVFNDSVGLPAEVNKPQRKIGTEVEMRLRAGNGTLAVVRGLPVGATGADLIAAL
jgi:hypothetical protein